MSKKRSLESTSFSLYDDEEFLNSTRKKTYVENTEDTHYESSKDENSFLAEKLPTFFAVCGWRKGEREEMQDRHLILDTFSIDVDDINRCSLYALFDGHAGKAAAEYCEANFANRLATNCAKYSLPTKKLESLEKSMKKMFTDSFKNIDDEFLKEAKSRRPTLKDGTTATTIILLNDVLYCANIGDSRAIVCRLKENSKEFLPLQITVDHSPLMFSERMRIQKAGGLVKDGRVLGILEVSRSIGDGQFKAHGVTCVPDIKKVTLTSNDLFVLLACDGLWKAYSSSEAIDFVMSKYTFLKSNSEFMVEANNSGDPINAIFQKISDELSAAAVLKGCGDNVSVILINLVFLAMYWPSSLKVDQEILLSTGNYVQRLKMYPYFDVAHYILTVSLVREDLGAGCAIFTRRHPLSCWLSSMVVCFAGSFLTNFLLGEPVIATFKRQEDIFLATLIWYLVFYSPFDVIYKLSKFLPLKIVLFVLKETQRVYKIHQGVAYAAKLYPNAFLIHVIIGTAKGAGSGIIRIFEQLIRGVWMPTNSEILRPTFTTKACVLASIVFTLDKNSAYINLPSAIVYLGLVLFFVYFKLSALIFNVTDPLAPLENLFCAIFFGGIWDALSRAIATSKERGTACGKVDNGPAQSDHKKDQ